MYCKFHAWSASDLFKSWISMQFLYRSAAYFVPASLFLLDFPLVWLLVHFACRNMHYRWGGWADKSRLQGKKQVGASTLSCGSVLMYLSALMRALLGSYGVWPPWCTLIAIIPIISRSKRQRALESTARRCLQNLKCRKGTLTVPTPVRKGVRSESSRKRKVALASTQVWKYVQEQNDRRRKVSIAIMQVEKNVEREESAGIKIAV